ncbi:Hypothetical predicted protein [Octopus vulgaris]|uniref:Uncharacterized protein n=1 Tax=Octopus vulgaris TaxID=6645 RepID=A0AA36F7P9_OCTVU|nr:Hypothetical predicted protein [Octopus vulgaris]
MSQRRSELSPLMTPSSFLLKRSLLTPEPPANLRPMSSPDFQAPYLAYKKDILSALRSFSASNGGGADSLRPGPSKDLMSPLTAEANRRLLSATTAQIHSPGPGPLSSKPLLFISPNCSQEGQGNVSHHCRQCLL